jgi:hypothetical protein
LSHHYDSKLKKKKIQKRPLPVVTIVSGPPSTGQKYKHETSILNNFCRKNFFLDEMHTSRANNHHRRPMLCADLLLPGMATSTNLKGESVMHKAITGMLTYEASVMGWWS